MTAIDMTPSTTDDLCPSLLEPSAAEGEAALVGRMVAGEATAWREFQAKYDRLIYRCITRVTARFAARLGTDDVKEIYATLLLQLFVTGRLFMRIGTTAMLCIVPLVSVAGFAALAAAPVAGVLMLFQVARRTFDFALMRPARESLYVPLPREDKYKTKNVIDTFVYRGGDQFGVWAQGGLVALGFGAPAIALVALPLAAAWLVLAAWLGRAHARLQAQAHSNVASDRLPGETQCP